MTATRATRAVRARAELSTAAKYLIKGHADGSAAFIGTRCDNVGRWLVFDSNAGHVRGPDFWDGRMWRCLNETTQPDAYRFTREEAHQLAEQFAAQASEIHQVYANLPRPEFLRWLAGEAWVALEAARAAVAESAVA